MPRTINVKEAHLKIIPEIDIGDLIHQSIQELRNASFPKYQVQRSYYKQLPHYRALQYDNNKLIGYAGLDYRVIRVGKEIYKILGVMDFCVDADMRGQGVGTSMLKRLSTYAKNKDVDFIILISDDDNFYIRNGFQQIKAPQSWLRIDEHKNYGVAFEYLDDLFIKQVGNKTWKTDHVDWLGYMF